MSGRPSPIEYTDPIYLMDWIGSAYGIEGLQWERAVAVDINGDGIMEIVISTTPEGSNNRPEAANPVIILAFRDGRLVDITNDVLAGPVGGSIVRNFVVADFNGDGIMDILINNTGTEAFWPFPGEQNRLLLSDGQGGYIDASHLLPQLTDFSHGSVAADFTGDGHIDLFINNLGDVDSNVNYLLINDGQGGFSQPHFMQSMFGHAQSGRFSADFANLSSPYHAELMDYGGNGIYDIYLGYIGYFGPETENAPLGFAVAVNDGHGNFTLVYDDALAPDLPGDMWRDGVALQEMTRSGDLNGNGLLDMVVYWAGPGLFYLQVLENRGADGYVDVSYRIEGQEAGNLLPPIVGTPDFYLVDIDGDGDLDLVVSRWNEDFSDRVVLWFENDGNGTFRQIDPAAYPGSIQSIIADVNGDGIPDIVYMDVGWSLPYDFDLDRNQNYITVQLGMPGTPEGARLIEGSNRNDRLEGTNGADVIHTGNGNNRVDAGAGADRIFTGTGNDTVYAGNGFDFIDARAGGRNQLYGGAGNDTIWGGDHGDTIDGGSGDDVIIAGAGNDLLIAGGGNNLIRAGAGNDTIIAGSGDTVHGGDGVDRLILESGGPRAVSLTVTAQNGRSVDGYITFADGSRLTFFGIEDLPNLPTRPADLPPPRPGDPGQTVTGTMTGDVLAGTTGNDLIDALAGDDLIFAIGGNNVIWGGRGNDTVWGGAGNDTVGGGLGDDVLHGVGGNNLLWGGEGNDTVWGGTGNDTVGGGLGNDLIYGGAGRNELWGGRGDDTIHGGAGGDSLGGGAGNDLIIGGTGNDTIYANEGNDTVYGGGGADVFVFFRNYEHTLIGDFDADDQLDLARGLWRSDLSAQQVVDRYARLEGGSIVLDFGDANTVIVLEGYTDLSALADQINIL